MFIILLFSESESVAHQHLFEQFGSIRRRIAVQDDVDHGYYVVQDSWLRARDYRILVRDDGREILTYHHGKRVESEEIKEERFRNAYIKAEDLQVTIKDFKELEKRILRTSLEIQKYEKRLQKE